ncbi:MAG: hypothetical protein H8D23_11610 [Candidatus Brocadiales bacterium]|nr:hypothetical protein [Candidatus Brocadiales bacterium]
MGSYFLGTCPRCGFTTGKQQDDPSNELKSLWGQRGVSAQNSLTKAGELIAQNIPSDNTVKAKLQFMHKISDIKDPELIRGLQQYINSTHWQTGKGWHYLAAIIRNVGVNSERFKYNEKKRIGVPPPVRKLNELG